MTLQRARHYSTLTPKEEWDQHVKWAKSKGRAFVFWHSWSFHFSSKGPNAKSMQLQERIRSLPSCNVVPVSGKHERWRNQLIPWCGEMILEQACQAHTVSCIAGYLTWIPGGVVANSVPGRWSFRDILWREVLNGARYPSLFVPFLKWLFEFRRVFSKCKSRYSASLLRLRFYFLL